MAAKQAKLTAKQIRAIALLAEGVPHHRIAAELKMSQRTIERWATRPDIKQAVEQTQAKAVAELADELFQKCRDAVTKTLPKAVRRMAEALDDDDPRIQIRAAEAIAKWSGFYLPNRPPEAQPNDPEVVLKQYLTSINNGHTTANPSS